MGKPSLKTTVDVCLLSPGSSSTVSGIHQVPRLQPVCIFVKSDYTCTTTSEVDFVKYPFGCAKFDYMMRQVPLPTTPVIYENVYGYTTSREDPVDSRSLW